MDETLYKEVIQSVKVIGDLAARLDERVRAINDYVDQLQDRIESLAVAGSERSSRISVLESRNHASLRRDINKLERQIEEMDDTIESIQKELGDASRWRATSESRWKMVVEFVYKSAYAVLVAYLLYKFNFPEPKLP